MISPFNDSNFKEEIIKKEFDIKSNNKKEIKMKKFNTKKYIQAVEKFLIDKYGEIKPEWEATIFLLSDNLSLYDECSKKIAEVGIFNVDQYKKNPLIATLKDLQATILKEVQHLGLSPYAASKIGSEDNSEDELLKNLIGEEEEEDGV